MKVASAVEKMTDFYKGNIHDIYHFLKVWAYAKNIGKAEGLDPKTQETLEMAAVVMISPARCAARNTETPAENIRKRRAHRWLQNFSKMCLPENWMSTALHGWLPIIIPTPMWREWITRSCWKPISLSMPGRADIRNRRLKISAARCFGRKRERGC